MRSRLLTASLLACLVASCGWFSSNPVHPDSDVDGAGDGQDSSELLEGSDGTPDCFEDEDCDDGEPCNGRETCSGGRCRDGTPLRDDASCTNVLGAQGRCIDEACIPLTCGNGTVEEGEECDDGDEENGDGCNVTCLFSCRYNEECDDENVCTLDLCMAGGTGRLCEYDAVTGTCDDGLFCTAGDACTSDGECIGRGETCDDGVACTDDGCDESADSCASPVAPGWCLIGGECVPDGEADPASRCRQCLSASNPTGWSSMPAGSPCEDGYACTEDDCDGSGTCVSTPNDALCDPWIDPVCLPLCFPSSTSGCGAAPLFMMLNCDAPPAGAWTTTCRLNLVGTGLMTGQVPCLSCTTEVGFEVIDLTDFGDRSGSCSLNGWSLVTTPECCDAVAACTPAACTMPCCNDFGNICHRTLDSYMIQMSESRCHAMEEARFEKTFRTTGFTDLELCFYLGEDDVQAADSVLVYAGDATHPPEQVFCQTGEVQAGADNTLYPICVDLPSWADENAALTVEFVLHTESSGSDWYLDTVSLRGWVRGCAPDVRTVFQEDFTGCASTIPDGWNGWDAISSPRCAGTWSCPSPSAAPSAYADRDTWILERVVDATELDGDVELCFSAGDNSSNGDQYDVEFDAGGGLQTAWTARGNLGANGTCRTICVKLSDTAPTAANNPSLMLSFSLDAAGTYVSGTYLLDDISLSGAVNCDGAGIAGVGPITETGGGTYEFTVTDISATPMSPRVRCTWGPSPGRAAATSLLRFTN